MICNVCDNCIHSAVCDRKAVLERIPYMTHCTYKHTEADIIHPELEKIKAEIHILKLIENRERNFAYTDIELAKGYELALKDITSIIDRNVAELKGEQK